MTTSGINIKQSLEKYRYLAGAHGEPAHTPQARWVGGFNTPMFSAAKANRFANTPAFPRRGETAILNKKQYGPR